MSATRVLRSISVSRPAPRLGRARQAGFTMIEALVSLFIAVGILVGVLTLFDRNNQLARAQTNIAQMQHSLRVGQDDMTRYIRMAGRGGMPRGPIPAGLALGVRNNVPLQGDDRYIAEGDADSPLVLPGTDVLTVRGAIASSVYQVNPLGGGFQLDDLDAPTTGTIRVENPHSTTGVTQDLDPLIDAIRDDPHAALLLVSPVDTWVVVEVDEATSVTDEEDSVVVGFRVGELGGPEIRDRYLELSGGFPTTLRNVAHVALLEESRYYVREERAIAGDDQSDLVPRLVKARFYPNTELPHVSDPEFGAEVSDNILDLQFALGVDADGDGRIAEGVEPGEGGELPVGSVSKAEDEWLFNVADDLDGNGDPVEDTKWNPGTGSPTLAYVRITTIARTDRRDMGYLAPLLETSEDKDFDDSPHDVFNTVGERRFRRRQLQTVVDMRNL
jgi:type II secretory pathway pseudopilin PulG